MKTVNLQFAVGIGKQAHVSKEVTPPFPSKHSFSFAFKRLQNFH
jgi:hypothetical protein